jgi:O-antigen ligase
MLMKNLFKLFFSFELIFVLFLFAGRYKADPRFDWIPVDLTAFFFCLSVVVGVFILMCRNFRIKINILIYVLLATAFIIYIISSLMWTPGQAYAEQKAFYIATLTYWSLIATTLIIAPSITRIRRFVLIIFVFSCWVALESFNVYLQSKGMGFVNALGGNYLGVGRVLGLGALIVLVYLIFYAYRGIEKLFAFVLFAVFMMLLLVVGGRVPLLATVLSAAVPFVVSFRINTDYQVFIKKYIIPLYVVFGALVIGIAFLLQSGYLTTTMNRLLVLLEPGMGASAGKRLLYYVSSFYIWMEQPIIGHGIGSWPIMMGLGDVRAYPHNIMLEILCELGLIGLFLFCLLIAFALKQIIVPWRILNNSPIRILVLMLFFNTFINAMVSGDLHDNRVLFAMLGLMVLTKEEKKGE